MTVKDVATYLHINESSVYGLAVKHNLPLRIMRFKERGAFCFKKDLQEWLLEESVPYCERKMYDKG